MKNLKTILVSIILMGLFNVGQAQCLSVINGSKNMYNYNQEENFYLNASTDVLKAQDAGVDFDIELGFHKNSFVYYAFYGMYDRVDYTNYGGGVDYQLLNSSILDGFVGVNVGGISSPTNVTIDNVHRFAYAFRAKTLLNITNSIGITLVGQYQDRPDLDKEGVFEVNAGVQFTLD